MRVATLRRAATNHKALMLGVVAHLALAAEVMARVPRAAATWAKVAMALAPTVEVVAATAMGALVEPARAEEMAVRADPVEMETTVAAVRAGATGVMVAIATAAVRAMEAAMGDDLMSS